MDTKRLFPVGGILVIPDNPGLLIFLFLYSYLQVYYIAGYSVGGENYFIAHPGQRFTFRSHIRDGYLFIERFATISAHSFFECKYSRGFAYGEAFY